MTEIMATPLKTLAGGFAFTEDPRWRNGRLYFSDTVAGRVHTIDEAGRTETLVQLEDDHASGLGFTPGGGLLIVSVHKRKLMRLGAAGLREHADLSHIAISSINDMAVDRAGRAYVGQMGSDVEAMRRGEPFKPAPLIVVEPDGTASLTADGLMGANGAAITEDGRTLIVAESAAGRIAAFDLATDGTASNYRVFAKLPQGHGPDGLCIDSVGGVWVACIDKGVLRIEEGGAVTHVVPVPEGRNAYACMLGGVERRTLFICTAGHYLEDLIAKRNSQIDCVPVPFSGTGLP
jgi:sugar lactone lactonase YvrE